MENKKSFLLHYDSLEILEILDDEQCWKLLRKMKSYHNWNNYVCDDQGVNIAFVSFKNQFDRDMGKYANVCARNKINGTKWGRPQITQDNPKNPVGLSGNPKKPKKPDSDSDKDNDKDIVSSINKDEVYMQAWHLSISHDEFTKLEKEFWSEKSDELVRWVLNYRKNSKYKSLYLTAQKWGRLETKKQNAPVKRVQITTLYDQS